MPDVDGDQLPDAFDLFRWIPGNESGSPPVVSPAAVSIPRSALWLGSSDAEVDDIVAFLNTLTDGYGKH